ncbi:hypothetical protein M885DRAFT_612912 [Pelagophyceae sp. CCMP2097]|nr:hypothetical protein M885DRAFT_612912 [Pelagophyceae sp. CCMP2097]
MTSGMTRTLLLCLLTAAHVGALAPSRAAATAPRARTTRRSAGPRTKLFGSGPKKSDDDDGPKSFFTEAPQKERDTLVPALAVGSILFFGGVYATETLRLISRGEFYMPHFF